MRYRALPACGASATSSFARASMVCVVQGLELEGLLSRAGEEVLTKIR
jgi:hypothetical protein